MSGLGGAVGVHEDLRHFGAGEFRRRRLAFAQHRPDFCSRQENPVFLGVVLAVLHHDDLVQLLRVGGVVGPEDLVEKYQWLVRSLINPYAIWE